MENEALLIYEVEQDGLSISTKEELFEEIRNAVNEHLKE